MLAASRETGEVLAITSDLRYRVLNKALQFNGEQALTAGLIHDEIHAVEHAPSGRWMLGIVADMLTRFDTEGRAVMSLPFPGGAHDIVQAVHGDGLLAIGNEAVVAWSADGPSQVLKVPSGINRRAAAWDLAARAVILGTRDGLVRFDAASGSKVWSNRAPFTDHELIKRIDLGARDDQPAVFAATDRGMGLFALSDGHLLQDFPERAADRSTLIGSGFVASDLLWTLAEDGVATLWDTRTGKRVSSKSRVSGLAAGPSGSLAVVERDSTRVAVTRIQDGKHVQDAWLECGRTVEQLRSVAWSPNQQWIAAAGKRSAENDAMAGSGDQICLWLATSMQFVSNWDAKQADITRLSFSPTGRLLTDNDDGAPRLWEVATQTPVAGLLRESLVTAMFVEREPYIVTRDSTGTIRIYDARTTKPRALLSDATDAGLRLLHAADERSGMLALADDRGGISVIDVRAGARVRSLPPDHRSPTTVAISRGGGSIAVASDHRVRLWSSMAPPASSEITLDAANVEAMAFSPDGRWLATADGLRVVQETGLLGIWDVMDGHQVLSFATEAPLTAVDWSHDGTHVAVGGKDGLLQTYDLSLETRSPAVVSRIIERMAPRLTQAASPHIAASKHLQEVASPSFIPSRVPASVMMPR
jgi:WD40 repeat protein